MPEGARTVSPSPSTDSTTKNGLAAVNPLDHPPGSQRSSPISSRFEEYKVEGEDEGRGENVETVQAVNAADIPAASDGIEVIRIKRKKKKADGSGKKRDNV
jgi:hypothetical protein